MILKMDWLPIPKNPSTNDAAAIQKLLGGKFGEMSQVLREQAPTALVQVLADGEVLLTAISQALVLPQLVLLDLNMPRMEGLEALGRIRANAQYARLPVLVLTTSDSEDDRTRAQALRADGYLVKPTTVAQLSQLIGPSTSNGLQPLV